MLSFINLKQSFYKSFQIYNLVQLLVCSRLLSFILFHHKIFSIHTITYHSFGWVRCIMWIGGYAYHYPFATKSAIWLHSFNHSNVFIVNRPLFVLDSILNSAWLFSSKYPYLCVLSNFIFIIFCVSSISTSCIKLALH